MLNTKDKAVIQELAKRVAEIAALPVQEEKRRLWLDHNTLRPTRPVVFCDPETSWTEIIPPESLACTGTIARVWEFHLRREIFWGAEMKDDRVVDRAARQLHEEAFSIIDCTRCANCCKTVSPLFTKADIRRIAKHLGVSMADFRTAYLEADDEGDLHLKKLPCAFLADDGP